jgi:hypothetical protein
MLGKDRQGVNSLGTRGELFGSAGKVDDFMTNNVVTSLKFVGDSEGDGLSSMEISLFPDTRGLVTVLLELEELGRARNRVAVSVALGHVEEHGAYNIRILDHHHPTKKQGSLTSVVRPDRVGRGVT